MTPPMRLTPAPPALAELERCLADALALHARLAETLDAHAAAVRRFDARAIEQHTRAQAQLTDDLLAAERRRRHLAQQAARTARPPTFAQLGDLFPARRAALEAQRQQLAAAAARARDKLATLARCVAAATGGLNSAVRLLALAAGAGGTYARTGAPAGPRSLRALDAVA